MSARAPFRAWSALTGLMLLAACTPDPAVPEDAGGPRVGLVDETPAPLAPDVDTPSLDGSLRLGDLVGQPVVLTFWLPGSAPSDEILPALDAAQDSLTDIRFVGVALDARDPVRLQSLADSLGVRFPIASDPDRDVAARFSLEQVDALLPTTFVLGADGRIVARRTGRMNAAEVTALARTALAAQRPEEATPQAGSPSGTEPMATPQPPRAAGP